MDGCFLCKHENYMSTNTGATIEILDGNKFDVDFGGCSHEPCINIEINYCPMCGRKLESNTNKEDIHV